MVAPMFLAMVTVPIKSPERFLSGVVLRDKDDQENPVECSFAAYAARSRILYENIILEMGRISTKRQPMAYRLYRQIEAHLGTAPSGAARGGLAIFFVATPNWDSEYVKRQGPNCHRGPGLVVQVQAYPGLEEAMRFFEAPPRFLHYIRSAFYTLERTQGLKHGKVMINVLLCLLMQGFQFGNLVAVACQATREIKLEFPVWDSESGTYGKIADRFDKIRFLLNRRCRYIVHTFDYYYERDADYFVLTVGVDELSVTENF